MRRPAFIARQSRCPSGVLGWLIARIMETETASENDATLDRLELQPHDRVLEVGFGPGRALERAAGVVTSGMIAGVDVSEEMIGMANRRCDRFVREGRMELRLGGVESLPFGDGAFDKVYSVHTLYFWERPAEALGEIRRVLRQHGMLALCFRPSGAPGTADFPAGVYRFYDTNEVTGLLHDGGFHEVAVSEPTGSRGLVIASARAR